MFLKVVTLGVESGGKPVVFLHKQDADEIGVTSSSRVKVIAKKESTALVNLAPSHMKKGLIGVNEEVRKQLALKNGSLVDVKVATFPKSLQFIRHKLSGRKLLYQEIREIVRDVVAGNLSEGEISAFVTALHLQGLNLDEATSLTSSMVESGNQLKLGQKKIVDKHSIGGVPGDKTTLLVVPIVAAANLIIPKTSSRAITSAAGTADRAAMLMPVDLEVKEMKKVLTKCNGCIVWGGALDLAPADDIFVRSEYSLSIDPLLLPSIMSKKKAVGATHLIIDIPTGRGAKVKTIGEADLLSKDMIELGRRLGIHTHCVLTYGEQPIGLTMGPALEAREALSILMNESKVPDLIDKACHIAGSIFEIAGKKNGYNLARNILHSGKAENKLRDIISHQGGRSSLKPDDLPIGEHITEYRSKESGVVLWMDNSSLVETARAAGAPKDKGAGIVFNKKSGDKVSKGDVLFTVHAEKTSKLSRAQQILLENQVVGVGRRMEMFIHRVEESPVVKRAFVLDR